VFALTLNIGNERVRAIIKEKGQAQKVFARAQREGKSAALISQLRPNMFSQRIANLVPGIPIEVVLEYVHRVPKVDNAYELVVPLVVGPRFQPRENVVGAVQAQLRALPAYPPVAALASQSFDVPEQVTADRVALEVRLALGSGLNIANLRSATHSIEVTEPGDNSLIATLTAGRTLDNRDFVLRYTLGGEHVIEAGLLAHADERGGYFSLLIEPPAAWQEAAVLPREMVFLLDCSGSMRGAPMDASKAYMRVALKALRPLDRFRIIRFSDSATEFSQTPLLATSANIAQGLRYINLLSGSGGTVMSSGVRQALSVPQPPNYVRNVIFLTDGYIGNEYEILELVSSQLSAARLFSVGVGTGVNRFLLTELARVGRGFARFIDPSADFNVAVADLVRRLQTPLLTDLNIDWADLAPFEVMPSRLPDLYAGDSLRVQGRYGAGGDYRIVVRGRSGDEWVTLPIDLWLPAAGEVQASASQGGDAIALIWARSAVADAMHQFSIPAPLRIDEQTDEQIRKRVTDLGLDYSLVTQWTAFVAVSEQIYNHDPANTREQPIPLSQVKGVDAAAYGTESQANVSYAAPEPAVYLSLLLLAGLMALAIWLGLGRADGAPSTMA